METTIGYHAGGTKTTNAEFAMASPGKLLQSEIASRLNREDWYAYMHVLPNPDPVLRKANIFHQEIDDMLGDGFIYSKTQTRYGGTMTFEWKIEQGKAESNTTQLVTDYITGLKHGELIPQVLGCVASGYEVFEINKWYSSNGFWMPKQPTQKKRMWFDFDKSNNLLYHKNTGDVEGTIVLRLDDEPAPPEQLYKFLLARNKATYENPYGESLLTRCYWNHFFKREGKKFWAIFTEQFGMPWVIAKYLEGLKQEAIDEYHERILGMLAGRVITIPDTSEATVESAGSNSNSADNYERFLNDARKEITMLWLGHESMTQNTASKLGNDTTELKVAQWIVNSDKLIYEEFMNTLISYIYNVNGLKGALPVFQLFQEEEVDTKLAERDAIDYSIGVRHTKKYFIKTRGYAEDEIEIQHEQPQQPQPQPQHIPQRKAAFSFAEHQQQVDDAVQQLVNDSEAGNAVVAEMMKSVFEHINSHNDYESAKRTLANVYAGMQDSTLLDVLAVIASGELFGRYAAQQEEGD